MKTQLTLIVIACLFAASCSKKTAPSSSNTATGVQGTWHYKDVKYTSKDGSKSDRVQLMGTTIALMAHPDFIFDEKGGLKIYDPKEKNYRTCQYTIDNDWLHTTCDGNKGALKVKQHKDELSLADTLNKVTIVLERKQ